MTTPPIALTIAGSDSGGGAGIQADLRTFAAFGVHGCSAIAALTAQSTAEVRGVVATDPGFLRDQIDCVLDDLSVAAVKTGMLATAANVRVVAALASKGRLPNLVVDPVMVSSTGARLLDDDAVDAYLHDLFPHATVVTPNAREAAVLTGAPVDDLERQIDAVHRFVEAGSPWAVVKGGDLTGTDAVDIAGDGAMTIELTAPRIVTRNNHGTGCSFASAIAAQLARGAQPLDAIQGAKSFVHAAIVRAAGWELGAGHGPIDHLDFAHPLVDRLRATDRT
jgi:hydroxymethylpyrimidine/phosphomethylpyrimidine kinase